MGEPHTWAGVATAVFPAAMSRMASSRCTLRLVGIAAPYSPLRLTKPELPSGKPTLPDTVWACPSAASGWPPARNSRLPPVRSSRSWKFMTPAMASEPYWADAPSRSTSTWRNATAGITAMSGPCAPSATPLPNHAMAAARWRRLPFTSTSVWSGAKLRRFAGREIVAASAMGWMFTLYDGAMFRSRLLRSVGPWLTKSVEAMASTGTGDAVTALGRARLPTATKPSKATAAWESSTSRRVVSPLDTTTSRTSTP